MDLGSYLLNLKQQRNLDIFPLPYLDKFPYLIWTNFTFFSLYFQKKSKMPSRSQVTVLISPHGRGNNRAFVPCSPCRQGPGKKPAL